jgi:transposase
MDSITRIRVAYALRKQGIAVEAIAGEVGRDRATVYRWLKGIKQRGIEGYIRHYPAKKGRRRRKVHSYIVQRVLSIRRAYRDCCGQKIVYLLAQEGIKLSLNSLPPAQTVQAVAQAHAHGQKTACPAGSGAPRGRADGHSRTRRGLCLHRH